MGTSRVNLTLLLALVGVVFPLTLVRFPMLWDYPNHLVRISLELGRGEGTALSQIYVIDWSQAWTNIGIDVVAQGFGRLFTVETTGSLVVATALLIVPLGLVMLNRSLFRQAHWWQVALVLFAWNFIVIGGLLNYQIGLGLAMLACALEPRLAQHPAWFASLFRLLAAAAMLIAHGLSVLFYVLMLAAMAYGPRFAAPSDKGAFARRILGLWLPALAPAALFVLVAPKLPGAHVAGSVDLPKYGDIGTTWMPLAWADHLSMMLTPLKTYTLGPDLAVFAALLLPVLYALLRRSLEVHAGLFLAALLLFVVAQFMPTGTVGTGLIEKRLPAMAGLMLGAAFLPVIPHSARTQNVALALALFAVLLRSGWIAHVWLARQPDVAAVERASTAITPGAAVLLVENYPGSPTDPRLPLGRYAHAEPIFRHLPTLVVMWRQAFVPTLFAAAGKKPLRVLPPYLSIAVPEGGIPNVSDLDNPARLGEFHYLAQWRQKFNFVLLVNADVPHAQGSMAQVPGVTLLSDEGFARLYRIDKPAGNALN